MEEFSAIFSSIGRVTSCSTCCAWTPGQGVMATATRSGISGSLRCGMETYPYQPQMAVAIRSIQAICRCSTKKRAVLWTFSIISASLLCAITFPQDLAGLTSFAPDACFLWDYFDFVAILNQRATGDDDRFSGLQSLGNADEVSLSVPNLYRSLAGNAVPTMIRNDKYRESLRILRGAHNRGQRHYSGDRFQLAGSQSEGCDHSRLQAVVGIGDGHLDGKHAALGIGRRRDRGDSAVKFFRRRCRGDGLRRSQLHVADSGIRNTKDSLDQVRVCKHKRLGTGSDQGSNFDVARQDPSGQRRSQGAIFQGGFRLLPIGFRIFNRGSAGIQRRLGNVVLDLCVAIGFIEISRPVKIEHRLFVIRLGLIQLGLGRIDLIRVFALSNAGQNLALGYAIAHLQDARTAVSAFPLDDVVHVSSGLEGQIHLGERFNVSGVPETTALFEYSHGAHANRNCWMRRCAGTLA